MSIIPKSIKLKAVIIISIVLGLPAGSNADAPIGRIYPTDKVDIFKGGQKIGEFDAESPLPNGLLVISRGQSSVRTEWLTLVVKKGGQFSITKDPNKREFYIKEGSLNYRLVDDGSSNILRTPCVQTPFKSVAGSPDSVGQITVSPVLTRISLLSGGPLLLSRPEGEVKLEPGKQITFSCSGPIITTSMSDVAPAAGAASGQGSVDAAVAAGAMVAIPAAALILDDNDDERVMSPFQP